MTHSEEIKRLVLSRLLDKYSPGTALTDTHWQLAYGIVRADCILDTLQWKLTHLTAVL